MLWQVFSIATTRTRRIKIQIEDGIFNIQKKRGGSTIIYLTKWIVCNYLSYSRIFSQKIRSATIQRKNTGANVDSRGLRVSRLHSAETGFLGTSEEFVNSLLVSLGFMKWFSEYYFGFLTARSVRRGRLGLRTIQTVKCMVIR